MLGSGGGEWGERGVDGGLGWGVHLQIMDPKFTSIGYMNIQIMDHKFTLDSIINVIESQLF